MKPLLSVTRKFPSGRKASDHGEFSLAVMVSTLIAGDAFAGGGALVWPGNAGLGCGVLPANGDWAKTGTTAATAKALSRRSTQIHADKKGIFNRRLFVFIGGSLLRSLTSRI